MVVHDLHVVDPQRDSVLVIETNHDMRVFGQIRQIEVVAGDEGSSGFKAVQRSQRPLRVHLVAAGPPLSDIESILHVYESSRCKDIVH